MLSLSFLFWKDDLSAEEEQERGCRQYQVEEPVVTFLDKFNPHLPSWAWLWTWVRVFVCPVWEWSAELLSAPPTSSLLLTLMWQNLTFFCLFLEVFCKRNQDSHFCSSMFMGVRKSLLQIALHSHFLYFLSSLRSYFPLPTRPCAHLPEIRWHKI